MKKTLLGIALIALFFAGCPHGGDDDNGNGIDDGGGSGGGTTEGGTFVKFKNNEVFPVEVYSDSGRASLVVSVPAEGESASVAWQPGEADFYLKYTVNADGVSFPYVPPAAGGYLYTRMDEGKTRSITLPMLEETLSSAELSQSFTSDVYVKVQNDSAATLQFLKSSTVLKPENSQYSTVITGENVTYKVSAGSTAEYQFRKNGVSDAGLPAALTEFEAGHPYSLKFENSGVSLIVDTPLTISRIFASFLAVPRNLTVSASGQGSLALAWGAVEGAAGYNVYRSDSAAGIYVKVNSSLITGTSYTDTGLSAATIYYYKVSAVSNSGVESAQSAYVGYLSVSAIAAGWQHSLILKEDGSVWATGDNSYAQLGTGIPHTGRALRRWCMSRDYTGGVLSAAC
ncbi:MAG: fibronectin type III domain protein [Treponematales bacterium]